MIRRASGTMPTLREAVLRASEELAASPHLRETAFADATALLLGVLSISRATLMAHPDRRLDAAQQASYDQAIARRLRSEPIQYILATTEFFGLDLRVTPAVLIPRPETELLVEAILARAPLDARILDIGTGSGAIAIALATRLPRAQVTALDLSPEALAIARENARTHRLEERIRFFQSDLLSALPASDSFEVIASNPPYVPLGDAPALHPQVRDYEPAQALYAGADGLALYRRLIPAAHERLTANGLLALEIGYGQRDALAALLAAGWSGVEFLPDLQGIPRVALARRA